MTSSIWAARFALPTSDPCPLGPCLSIDVGAGGAVLCTYVAEPTPYVIVRGDPDRAEIDEANYEVARKEIAAAAGVPYTPSSPKLAVVAPAGPGSLKFKTRMRAGADGYHPGVAQGGLVALGVAALREFAVPQQLLHTRAAMPFDVHTPAGPMTLTYVLTPRGLALSLTIGTVTLNPEEGNA